MVRVSQIEVLPGVYFRITELEGLGKKFIACSSCDFLLHLMA